jgi:hypothetical protein
MSSRLVLLVLLVVAGSGNVLHAADNSADVPEHTRHSTAPSRTADSYGHALQVWKTPEDISAWIAANFSYDPARAMRLSETQRAEHGELSIYTPSEFFAEKSGVCVDLSRFDV